MIEKILVALDGSESSDKALDFALDLAEKYSSEIMLLSVYQPPTPIIYFPTMSVPATPTTPPITTPISIRALSKELKAQHEKVLSEALKRLKNQRVKPDLKVSTMLREGRPSDKILKAAKEGKFDLIILGGRGMGGIKDSLLGSVSDRVADGANCSILIIK